MISTYTKFIFWLLTTTDCATTAANQCPTAVLDFRRPTDAYDVNVTPDKRKVLLHDEDAVLRAARAAIEAVYAPSRYTYDVGRFGSGEPEIFAGSREVKDAKEVKAERADDEPRIAFSRLDSSPPASSPHPSWWSALSASPRSRR